MSNVEVVFDTEANGLLREATKIWCICAKVVGSEEVVSFGPDKIMDGIKFLQHSDVIIGHNICGYDIPLIKKLYNIDLWPMVKRDTQVMSYLLNPDRGCHSVEDWTVKLGAEPKVQNEKWDEYDPIMIERCKSDVRITEQIYLELMKEWRDAS